VKPEALRKNEFRVRGRKGVQETKRQLSRKQDIESCTALKNKFSSTLMRLILLATIVTVQIIPLKWAIRMVYKSSSTRDLWLNIPIVCLRYSGLTSGAQGCEAAKAG